MEIQTEVLKIRLLQNTQGERTFSFGLAPRPWTQRGAGAEVLHPHPHVLRAPARGSAFMLLFPLEYFWAGNAVKTWIHAPV